jgi:hypothetical protein
VPNLAKDKEKTKGLFGIIDNRRMRTKSHSQHGTKMVKLGLATHESQYEAISHFARVANQSQSVFQVQVEELSPEEGDIFEQEVFLDEREKELYRSLYAIKLAHGYNSEDLFMAFVNSKLLEKSGEEFFAWANSVNEPESPGVGIVSFAYLAEVRNILDDPSDKVLAANSVIQNILCVLALLSTEIGTHYETTGCIMDFCRDMKNINYSLRKKRYTFCQQKGCREKLSASEAGSAVLAIAEALNQHPIRLVAYQQMMPYCFKTGAGRCLKVRRTVASQVFIGMPFRGFYEDIFEFAIKPTLEGLGYTHWKANDQPNIIDLMCKVCEGIQESESAIVDLSEWNPNVFFELGLSYALGRRVLIIKHVDAKIPVDLQGMEYLPYSSARDLKTKLRDVVSKVFL